MINYIKHLLKERKESLEKSKDSYRKETLERRFKNLPTNKEFKFLDLYDPFEFPLIITSEDVAKFLETKKQNNEVLFEKYLKCLNCDQDALFSEQTKHNCSRCKSDFLINDDSTYISFKKI